MQKLRGEQTNIEEELLELQEGIEATANKVKKLIGNEKMVLNFLLHNMNLHFSRLLYGRHCWKRLI